MRPVDILSTYPHTRKRARRESQNKSTVRRERSVGASRAREQRTTRAQSRIKKVPHPTIVVSNHNTVAYTYALVSASLTTLLCTQGCPEGLANPQHRRSPSPRPSSDELLLLLLIARSHITHTSSDRYIDSACTSRSAAAAIVQASVCCHLPRCATRVIYHHGGGGGPRGFVRQVQERIARLPPGFSCNYVYVPWPPDASVVAHRRVRLSLIVLYLSTITILSALWGYENNETESGVDQWRLYTLLAVSLFCSRVHPIYLFGLPWLMDGVFVNRSSAFHAGQRIF